MGNNMNDMVPFEEIQKAAAKGFGKQFAKEVFGFIGDITGPPAKELGGLLADHMKYFRFKTQLKIIQKAKQIQNESDIQPQKVPLKMLARFLESCSWEEDENMQKKWSALLANAATLDEPAENYLTYVDLLNQLSPTQAKCLDIMYNEEAFPARKYFRSLPSYQARNRLRDSLNISDKDLSILFDGLIRLNLIRPKFTYKDKKGKPSNPEIEMSYDETSLTYLGQDLVKKCRIRFTSIHAEKVGKICLKLLTNIIKEGHRSQYIDHFISGVQNIYEYAAEGDIRHAVYKALEDKVWKGGKLQYPDDFHIEQATEAEIVQTVIAELHRIYG
jgi:hypothetical protein